MTDRSLLSFTEIALLRSRLHAIAGRDLDDRTISPGEAKYLAAFLDREPASQGGAIPEALCACGWPEHECVIHGAENPNGR